MFFKTLQIKPNQPTNPTQKTASRNIPVSYFKDGNCSSSCRQHPLLSLYCPNSCIKYSLFPTLSLLKREELCAIVHFPKIHMCTHTLWNKIVKATLSEKYPPVNRMSSVTILFRMPKLPKLRKI